MIRYKPPLIELPDGLAWRDMDSAPRDGTVIAIRFHASNNPDNPQYVQAAHWLAGDWRPPLALQSSVFPNAWAPISEAVEAMGRGFGLGGEGEN